MSKNKQPSPETAKQEEPKAEEKPPVVIERFTIDHMGRRKPIVNPATPA